MGGKVASDEVMPGERSKLSALQLCLVSMLLKVSCQKSWNNFLEGILALPDHTGQATAMYFELHHSFIQIHLNDIVLNLLPWVQLGG